ncbi:MAG: Nudix family hydrolase [Betaproteobacteria bacterium]|nr:Nudix family hydrolase [Betaproteobacteria bacterium]
MAVVRVAAAVILRADGQVLLAQRPEGKPYAGYWEFPGGKLEAGETPRDALVRELHEELGLTVREASPWLTQRYTYPHADVELDFFRVFAWSGEPVGHDGQAFRWQTPGRFDVSPLLPANTMVLRALELPTVYGITRAAVVGTAAFLLRARAALDRGLGMIEVRERAWAPEALRALVDALQELAAPYGARILLHGDDALARAWGCAGVHWTAAQLAAATVRPAGLLVGASCRSADDIARAGALGLDFAVLGPVRSTPSHPDAVPIGWDGFARAVAATPLPVLALGGLARSDLPLAISHGAHGVALRRGAW